MRPHPLRRSWRILALALALSARADDMDVALADAFAAARAGDARAYVCGLERLLALRPDAPRARALSAALARDPTTFEAVRAGGTRGAMVEHALARLGAQPATSITSPLRIAELVRNLVTGSEPVQLASLPDLSRAGSRAVPGLVVFLAGDQSIEHRTRAVTALVRLGRAATPALVVRAVGANGELADDLVTVFAAVGDPRASGALASIAHDHRVGLARRERARATLARLVGAQSAARPPAAHWLDLARLSLRASDPATDLGDGAPAWELAGGRLVEASAPGALASAIAVESAARAALAEAPDDADAWAYLVLAKLLAVAELDAIRIAAGRGHAVVSPSEVAWIERETARAEAGMRVLSAAGPRAWSRALELAYHAGLEPAVLEATRQLVRAQIDLGVLAPDFFAARLGPRLDPDVRLVSASANLSRRGGYTWALDDIAAALDSLARPCVLIVADDPARASELRVAVRVAGGVGIPTRGGEHAVALARRFARAPVVLVDGDLVRPCAAAVVHALAADFRTRRMPVLVRLDPADPLARDAVYPRSARDAAGLSALVARELTRVDQSREPSHRRDLCRATLATLARSDPRERHDGLAAALGAAAKGSELAAEALRALDRWGTALDVLELVCRVCDTAAPVEQRVLAIDAVGSIAQRTPLPTDVRSHTEQTLRSLLDGDDSDLARAAGRALGRLRSP